MSNDSPQIPPPSNAGDTSGARPEHEQLPKTYYLPRQAQKSSPLWTHVKRLTSEGMKRFGDDKTHVCVYAIGPGEYCNKPLKLGKQKSLSKSHHSGDDTFSTSVGIDHMKREHPESSIAQEAKKSEAKKRRSLEEGAVMSHSARATKVVKQGSQDVASTQPANKAGGSAGTMTAYFESSKVAEQEVSVAQAEW